MTGMKISNKIFNCVVIVFTFVGVCSVSPVSIAEQESTGATHASEYDTVSIAEINAPEFCEDFATLTVGKHDVPVYWGAASGDSNVCIAWEQSGYPGFGYPIVIQSAYSCESDALLVTSWGYWKYEFKNSGIAFKEGESLIDKQTGECLINWGAKSDMLILWDQESEGYKMYELVEGTKVTT